MIRWIKKKLQKIKAQNNIRISSKFKQQMIADVSYEDHNEVSGERNSVKDQQSESEKGINGFESEIRSKDEEIRLLKHRLALKDEEMRHLKRQLHLREKESACLRIAIQSACTNLGTAVNAADGAFKFTNKNPTEKGMEYTFTEADLLGAEQTDP
ncbi:hypothetical protein NC652_030132 [Populus alba x Populus x berolinensis]|nr:hypothetical protein NC652_030132 [Populus alba x Populus x berolinensis]